MKWAKLLMAAFVAIALTSTPGVTGETIKRDADGNKWIVDTETAGTPGAGSGLGAIIGAVDDTLASFEKHKVDLQLGLSAAGTAGDDSSGTETALTSATVFYRPVNWFRIGPEFAWNTVDTQMFTFGLPFGVLINPDPWSTYNFWLALDVLPKFTIRTGDPDKPRDSAWTWAPAVGFKGELPMGGFSIEGGLGLKFPFAIEGVTDQSVNPAVEQVAFGADIAVNIRLGR